MYDHYKNGLLNQEKNCRTIVIPVPEKQTDDHISVSLNDQNAVINLVITAISTSWFPWIIPGFPLITLEFVKLTVNINGKEMDALVKRGETAILGNVRCTKHCNITIENISFIVLWEFTLCHIVDQAAPSNVPLDSRIDNNATGDMQTQHTIPFKVLGTCHSKERIFLSKLMSICMSTKQISLYWPGERT